MVFYGWSNTMVILGEYTQINPHAVFAKRIKIKETLLLIKKKSPNHSKVTYKFKKPFSVCS